MGRGRQAPPAQVRVHGHAYSMMHESKHPVIALRETSRRTETYLPPAAKSIERLSYC